MHAYIGVIMPTRVCKHKRDHAHAYIGINAGSCPCVHISLHTHAPTHMMMTCKCFVYFAPSISHANQPRAIHKQHCKFKLFKPEMQYSDCSTAAGPVKCHMRRAITLLPCKSNSDINLGTLVQFSDKCQIQWTDICLPCSQ